MLFYRSTADHFEHQKCLSTHTCDKIAVNTLMCLERSGVKAFVAAVEAWPGSWAWPARCRFVVWPFWVRRFVAHRRLRLRYRALESPHIFGHPLKPLLEILASRRSGSRVVRLTLPGRVAAEPPKVVRLPASYCERVQGTNGSSQLGGNGEVDGEGKWAQGAREAPIGALGSCER